MRRAVASRPPLLTDSRARSEDCDEERDVAQAWSAFSAAVASAADLRVALDAFLAVFLLRCSAWAPAEPGTLERAATARPRGCNAGHPLALLRALAQAVEQAASELACGALERQLPLCLTTSLRVPRSRARTVALRARTRRPSSTGTARSPRARVRSGPRRGALTPQPSAAVCSACVWLACALLGLLGCSTGSIPGRWCNTSALVELCSHVAHRGLCCFFVVCCAGS